MSEIHSAVGSYVINAMEGAELDEFEAHLAVCETCTREVGEFSETVAELALLAATPPPALRGSVLSAIKEVRPLPPELPAAQAGTATTVARAAAGGTAPVPGSERAEAGAPSGSGGVPTPAGAARSAGPGRPAGGLAPVVDLSLQRARRRGRLLIAGIAAALVVALGLGGWAYTLVRARDAQVVEAQLETQLFSAPDVKVVAATMRNGARVSFVSSKSLDKALFIGTDLPSVGSGKQYQLWTLTPQPRPDNLFDGGSSLKRWFSGPIADAGGLAVTIEPTGGSPQPTSPVLASANI